MWFKWASISSYYFVVLVPWSTCAHLRKSAQLFDEDFPGCAALLSVLTASSGREKSCWWVPRKARILQRKTRVPTWEEIPHLVHAQRQLCSVCSSPGNLPRWNITCQSPKRQKWNHPFARFLGFWSFTEESLLERRQKSINNPGQGLWGERWAQQCQNFVN